jgi:replicative DNA helicase
MSITQMRAIARRLKARDGISIVFIDYMQLVTPGYGDSRQVQVADISRGLKAMARELNVPVVACCQLNRGVEERIGHEPRLCDLRESGAIEQDADVVCLLHRPDHYDAKAEPNVAEINVAKQRNGRVGRLKLVYLSDTTKFGTYSGQSGWTAGD